VVTSAGLVDGRGHREVAAAAIVGGADAVQLRAPELPDRDLPSASTCPRRRCPGSPACGRLGGHVLDITARVEHRQILVGLISEYRRVA